MENRKIDALIAMMVMEILTKVDYDNFGETFPDDKTIYDICSYSTTIAAAWMVVEKMHDYESRLTYFEALDGPCWRFELFIKEAWHTAESYESAPMAICLAALKAVGVEI